MDAEAGICRTTGMSRNSGDEFVKCGMKDLIREADKACALHEVSRHAGLSAPRTVGTTISNACNRFEYMNEQRGIRQLHLRSSCDKWALPSGGRKVAAARFGKSFIQALDRSPHSRIPSQTV